VPVEVLPRPVVAHVVRGSACRAAICTSRRSTPASSMVVTALVAGGVRQTEGMTELRSAANEAVLDQPADRRQASQRPPGADHVEVDVGAVAGDGVAEVLLVSERQAGEVVHGMALTCLGPVDHAGDLVTPTNTWAICRSPCVNAGVHGRSAASATWRLRVTR
jgi:hypothetical protein